MLSGLDVRAVLRGREFALSTREYADGTVDPHGHRLLQSFVLDGSVPTWAYALDDLLLVQRVFMARGRNTTYVTYTLERGPAALQLSLAPLCAFRDYHAQRRGAHGLWQEGATDEFRVRAEGSATTLSLQVPGAVCVHEPQWHWNLQHRLERQRGLDDIEDLYVPGRFVATLEPGETLVCVATTEQAAVASWQTALAEYRAHEASLIAHAPDDPAWVRQLLLAADQFVVTRAGNGSDTTSGTTVIAGYPWFSDWGRDTMIALPGLALATGRHDIAASILRTFARHVDTGLLPNRFPDAGEAPEYNTVDATLWYFVAVHQYLHASQDLSLARELLPTLIDVIDWHSRGTRHGIRVDTDDGLLRAGEPGVQLTWMDAKVGDWVVTPRIGKPVEINALWCNALLILSDLHARLDDASGAQHWAKRANQAVHSFAQRFWNPAEGCLFDVVDVPGQDSPDASLRPNQVIALGLPHELLSRDRQRAALAACERALLTSCGLRTLATGDVAYNGRYAGDVQHRDGAYHQGTVWPWLLGAFARAHLRLHGDIPRARSYLEPLALHLHEACVGQVSEIFDGDPPHHPQGCFAQAWSVSELLAAWFELRAAERADDARRTSKSRITRTLRRVS
jgi:predicted glycogen debranching enzyme